MAMTHLFTEKQETKKRTPCGKNLALCTYRLSDYIKTSNYMLYSATVSSCLDGGGGAPALLTELAISSLPHIYHFFVRESNLNSMVDTSSSQCDPLTYLGVGLQSRLQLLWLCAVSKRHIKANFSGNSLKIAVRSLRVKGKKKSRHPTLYFLFQKTATLCNVASLSTR